MAVDRQTLIFFIVMFIIMSLPSGNEPIRSDKDRQTLNIFQNSITNSSKILDRSTYDTGYGNITGFQLSYDDHLNGKVPEDWPIHKYDKDHPWMENQKYSVLPNEISDKIRSFWGLSPVDDKAYLLNISGKAEGKFNLEKSGVKPTKLEIPKYLKDYYESREDDDSFTSDVPKPEKSTGIGNITFSSGVVSIALGDHKTEEDSGIDNAVVVKLEVSLKDKPEIEQHDLDMKGVYFQDIGAIVASTNSAKFYGGYALPHLAMNGNNFEVAKILMGRLGNVTKEDISIDRLNAQVEAAYSQCEYVTFLQLEKTKYTKDELRYIDDEMMYPTGKPLPKEIPKIVVSNMLMYSPDCGVVISSTAEGDTSAVSRKKVKNELIGLIVLVILDLYLILREMGQVTTPGALNKISRYSLIMLAFANMLIALTSLLMATLTTSSQLLLIAISATTFMSTGIFLSRFIVSVIGSQVNERAASLVDMIRGSNEPILPIAREPQQPEAPQPPTAETTNNVMGGVFIASIIALFITISALQWRIKYRGYFEFFGIIVLNSEWVFQIGRNFIKNNRKSLSWEFVVGESMLRWFGVWWWCWFQEKQRVLPIASFVWLMIQLGVLAVQSYNPRLWISTRFLPESYNYFRAFEVPETTCSICLTDIDGKNRKDYMVTPCDHVFHTSCLESWMQFKLQCPTCRSSLPPI
ncbi:Transmembrane E3 ubiquitin-protein ligase 1 [Candida tropicalis]